MYSQVFNLHAELLRAIAHPKRLEVIHLLRNQRLSVGEIQRMLYLPQANLSQHLQVLRKADVVKFSREGKSIFYQLSDPAFIEASDLLRAVLIKRHAGTSLEEELVENISALLPLSLDPVCQMRLSPKTAAFFTNFKNNKYYFCASGCLEAFKKDPAHYV